MTRHPALISKAQMPRDQRLVSEACATMLRHARMRADVQLDDTGRGIVLDGWLLVDYDPEQAFSDGTPIPEGLRRWIVWTTTSTDVVTFHEGLNLLRALEVALLQVVAIRIKRHIDMKRV